MRQVSPTLDYVAQQYLWWRHTFPEYVLPSSLPEPVGAPAPHQRDAPRLVPLDALRRRVAVWERQADNVLLFGHALPTEQEVAYRRAYLDWCACARRAQACLRYISGMPEMCLKHA